MYRVTAKSTQHGFKTPHGLNVPHKFPEDTGVSLTDILSSLVQQLYPTGRAFYGPEGGVFESLHKGINRSFIRIINDAKLVIDKTYPDNINFNELDATLWENRLGLAISPDVDLDTRKQIIKRKIAYPANIKARQHPLFIQSQLQESGFDVYVHENGFEENGIRVYKTPDEIAAGSTNNNQHGGDTQHGLGSQHGVVGFNVIANQINPNESYGIGGDENLWSTFFIGGQILGDNATISESRREEFRELVLKLKPAHTVAFLFINFV